jgi:hypothetical protein
VSFPPKKFALPQCVLIECREIKRIKCFRPPPPQNLSVFDTVIKAKDSWTVLLLLRDCLLCACMQGALSSDEGG